MLLIDLSSFKLSRNLFGNAGIGPEAAGWEASTLSTAMQPLINEIYCFA